MADAGSPSSAPQTNQNGQSGHEKLLFWACFIALIATAFGFIIRVMIIKDWGEQFNLSETQKGEIFGVGLWPFAISIVLFSLIIDKIGYGKAMVFAFLCHSVSAVITIFATGYWSLYLGTFIVALGNGTVEAVINPVVATMFPKEKTKWLNILHAAWPGGLVLGGLLMIGLADVGWQWKVGLILLPTVAYGLMMLGCRFPVNERVAAGVPYKAMLQEVGILGSLVVVGLIVREVGRVFGELAAAVGRGGTAFASTAQNIGEFYAQWDLLIQLAVGGALVLAYGAYVRTLGRPLFVFLLLIMIPLATTELGTDSWITDLMAAEMQALNMQAGWVLVYTSMIMMILRFFAGPIVHAMSPLGLLAMSSLIAATGLVFLSKAEGMAILAAATLYGFGKTFFWPTMLGVVAERFPKGGALTLNTIAGVGMLGVGVVGAALLGNVQDKTMDQKLSVQNPSLHAEVVGEEKLSVFGRYQPLDQDKIRAVPQTDRQQINTIRESAKKDALMTVAVLPVIMLVCYLGLILYFRAQGGYKAEVLTGHEADDDEFTGGVEGPVA